jgi:hypothetical protein
MYARTRWSIVRSFLLVVLTLYAVIFCTSWANSVYNDGDMLKALPAIVISQPWSTIFGSMAGDGMSYPKKIDSAIDDDCFSTFGCLVLIVSGLPNATIIFGLWKFVKKSN